jgi:hypothetical protein
MPITSVCFSKLTYACTPVNSCTPHTHLHIHVCMQVVLFGDLDGRLHLWRLGKHFIIQSAHEAAIANATAAAAAAASANSSSTTSTATLKHAATAATAGGTDVKSSHDVQIHSDTVMKVCMHACSCDVTYRYTHAIVCFAIDLAMHAHLVDDARALFATPVSTISD